MYFEFLFRRAHSRKRVDRMYWSGVSLYSFTTCSKEVTVGTTGPIGSGLPQLGFPRRFAIGPDSSWVDSDLAGLGAAPLRPARPAYVIANQTCSIHSKGFNGGNQARHQPQSTWFARLTSH